MKPALFIAIPRTASVSMCEALTPHGLLSINLHEDGKGLEAFDPARPLVTFQHASITSLMDGGTCTREWLADRWTFAFIRNPWDRMVSLYHYLFDVLGRHRRRYGRLEFAEFVRRVTEGGIDPIGAYNWRGLSQTSPQTNWLEEARNDFVGRWEHLDRDWPRVCEYLGIDVPLPHFGQTNRRPYREYYTPELKRSVGSYYPEDVEMGGYEF